jgi:hypothetical protein
MTISLPSYANGDTDYVAKMNNTNETVEQAINSLESQVVAQAGAGITVGSLMPALLGSSVACVGTDSYVPTGSGDTLTVSTGYAWLPTEGLVVQKLTTSNISFAGLSAATYYIDIDTTGNPSRSSTSGAYTLWSVVWGGASFGAIARVAPVVWNAGDDIAAQTSAAYGETFYKLDDRLEESETRIVAVEPKAVAYDITVWQQGKPDVDQVMLKVRLPRAVVFSANFAGSTTAPADVPATADTVFTIKKNGTTVGTLTYVASSAAGTFASTGSLAFAVDDVLTIVAPNAQDATLEGIAICLKGTK